SGRAPVAGVLAHHLAAHPAGDCLRVAAGVYSVLGRSRHHAVRRRTGLQHVADGHFFQGALRRDSGRQCSGHDHGADRGHRHCGLHGVDALPPAAARARSAACRRCQPVSRAMTDEGLGTDGAALASRALARPVLFLNDADAAGLAEMRFGSGRGCTGTVVMLTFGTGIGTALFTGGKLFPNSELGHLELHGMDAEKWASAQVRSAQGLDFPAWSARVNDYLLAMHKLLWPDVFILGGAVSERFA